MEVVIASVVLKDGNVLSFRTFPTGPYPLAVVLSLHVPGELTGEFAYRVRKRDDVIYQSAPMPFHAHPAEGESIWPLMAAIEPAFPGQGSYVLDVLMGDAVVYSLGFSVFDSSKRSDLEREIIYYLKARRGARSVEEITRGVYSPQILNKSNFAGISGKVYFALLRMQGVENANPIENGSLEERMRRSRWRLK